MTKTNKQINDFVYVKIPFCGFIPVLNVRGPIRASYVSKENIQKLIRGGYPVEFINKNAFPEFQKQMDAYKKACEAKDYVGAKAILTSPLDINPNSMVQSAIDAAGEANPNPEAAPVNMATSVIDAVNGGEGSEPVVENDDPNDDIAQQMVAMDSGENAGEGAGTSIFDGNATDFSETDSEANESVEDVMDNSGEFIDDIPPESEKKRGGKKRH